MGSQGWVGIFNVSLNADRLGSLQIILRDIISEKQNYLHKIKATMKAENFIDKVRTGDDIKLKEVKRN